MIKVTEIDRDYYRCNACLGEVNVKNISYGANEISISSFRLCEKCRKELIKLIKGEDK